MPFTATQMQEQPAVLVASSNAGFRQRVVMRLRQEFTTGLDAEEAEGGADALARVEMAPCSFVLLDTRLADLDPLEIAGLIRATSPRVEVLMFDSESSHPLCPGQAVHDPALRRISEILAQDLGGPRSEARGPSAEIADASEQASVAVSASIISEELAPTPVQDVTPAVQSRSAAAAPQAMPVTYSRAATRVSTGAGPGTVTPLPAMIGESESMARVYRMVRLVARRITTVLLTGESGTGKELVARAIHEISPRASGPYVTVNCAAIPESLMESELFGHSRGAFTGAVGSKIGRVSAAQGGTLFLDEIGELPLNLQSKLLRFLQAGEVQRLGSSDMIHIETRVVAATNSNLLKRVQDGTFRQDLYYRLAVFPIELPPLKDRLGDVIELARHFLSAFCRQAGQAPKVFSQAALRMLETHTWPGNVRELQHTIERASILADDEVSIEPEHLMLGA
jgi:DNA-binding NtrC family response regulator